MTEAHSRQAEQKAIQSLNQNQTWLDSIFQTRRIVNIAILASGTGMTILLLLTYLLKGKTTVMHIGILAVLMMLLLIALLIYKQMILNDPACNYDNNYKKVQQRQNEQNSAMNKIQVQNLHRENNSRGAKDKDSDKQDSGSESSSLVQVIPKRDTRLIQTNKIKNQEEDQVFINLQSKQN